MIGVVMGSKSDWSIMSVAVYTLNELNVPNEYKIISAHRTPDLLYSYAKTAYEKGINIIIAGAGGAAHLPGMLASLTHLPILGVPIMGTNTKLNGLDSLLSIVEMPQGTPVATFGINNARNAALFAVSMLSFIDVALAERYKKFRNEQTQKVINEELIL